MSDVRLVVQADDFGMCHAVNEGIVAAFTDGIVTQATVMAACPWFTEAAAMAAANSIPCGVHLTLTCEWDNLRWGPLTDAASLVIEDGTFHRSVEAVMKNADRGEAAAELAAQVARFNTALGAPIHLDPHMGAVPKSVVQAACAGAETPFLYPIGDYAYAFDSITFVSAEGGDDKVGWLVEQIERLEAGTHFFCTHPAVTSAELSALTAADAENAPWASTYRVSDLDALCSPEVRKAIEAVGVELVAVTAL